MGLAFPKDKKNSLINEAVLYDQLSKD